MKKILVCFLTVTFFIGTSTVVFAKGNNERYVEKKVFSIVIPQTWEVTTIKGYQFKILQGPFENNFTPSINFVMEEFNGQIDEYIVYFMDQIDNVFGENREYILHGEIITNNGLRGELIVITTFQHEKMIQFNFFCFPGNSGKNMIITCTNLANYNERFNELFINTVKTFEWLK